MALKVQQLENSLMELGTEMFRLKHQLADLQVAQSQMVKTMTGLKNILDEKGLITIDDFELAVGYQPGAERSDHAYERELALPPAKRELH